MFVQLDLQRPPVDHSSIAHKMFPDMVQDQHSRTTPLPEKQGWMTPKMWKRLSFQAQEKVRDLTIPQIADVLIRGEGYSMEQVSQAFEQGKKDHPNSSHRGIMKKVYSDFVVSKILPEESI